MKNKKSVDLNSTLKTVDFAFQPIVNIHTGAVYGYEALLRNVDQIGFDAIIAFFDHVHKMGLSGKIHQALLVKALNKYLLIPWADQAKLYFNLDGRLFDSPFEPDGFLCGSRSQQPLQQFAVPKGTVCLEISEQHEICNPDHMIERLKQFRSFGYRIAVDDFGTRFAGTHILYFVKPEYIKIDRFYIQNIKKDAHKRLLAASIVNIAHLMGSLVIAEGVETEEEFYCCKAIGCDLMQGYLVLQRPQLEIDRLERSYDHVERLSSKDKRSSYHEDESLILAEMEYIEPIPFHSEPIAILEAFKKNKKHTFFPVTNFNNEALGIIREETVKEYAYSEFGRSLLANPTTRRNIEKFVTRIPVVDIHTSVERILASFSAHDDLEGIIITNHLKYEGVLSAQSLLRIINEKKLAAAIDQNPLSNLPGNKKIYEYISMALQDRGSTYVIAYFDFDNFKVYNDTYGFRQGDRVIQLFAELLNARSYLNYRFAGHIGGDDFFMGSRGVPIEEVLKEIDQIREKFISSVVSFYDTETIRRGCLKAVDRDGENKCFPLMSISTAVLELPAYRSQNYTPEEIGRIMAEMKKQAKRSENKLWVSAIDRCHPTAVDGP